MSRVIASLLILTLTYGCSTIVHQTTQQVRINSKPEGAAVTVSCGDVNNDPKLVTPAVVTLHRKPAFCSVKLAKDGYVPKEVKFEKSMSALYVGNIIFGGIIGLIVDGANGAMWNRTPGGEVSVSLDTVDSAKSVGQPSSK